MKKGSQLVNQLLVVIGSIFVVILVVMAAISIYLSIGGSNKATAYQGFYSSEAASVSSTVSATADTTEDTSSIDSDSSDTSGNTTIVQAGEGEAAIAARVGISIAELERLNPSHMTTGSWYADPGDVVNIQ